MKKIFLLLVTLFSSSLIYAQSAKVVTEILNTKEFTYGQACYLAAIQQDFINEDATYEEAVTSLIEHKQLPYQVFSDQPLALANLAFIFSKAWNVSGGLMYKLTRSSPRYAFKQFKADGIIAEKAEPSDFVTGPEALNILTACLVQYGGLTLDNIGE